MCSRSRCSTLTKWRFYPSLSVIFSFCLLSPLSSLPLPPAQPPFLPHCVRRASLAPGPLYASPPSPREPKEAGELSPGGIDPKRSRPQPYTSPEIQGFSHPPSCQLRPPQDLKMVSFDSSTSQEASHNLSSSRKLPFKKFRIVDFLSFQTSVVDISRSTLNWTSI